jgi:hypothetical protein
VDYISKGKARVRYEFACKVSVATTLDEGFVVGLRSFPGAPYSGHTLSGVDRTWGSCGAFSVSDGQPTIENSGPCDGYSVSPFGRPPHPSALSHAGIGNVID